MNLLLVFGTSGQTDMLAEAEKALNEQQYERATELLNQSVTAGTKSEAVFYNLGYAELKLGNVGEAVLAIERSLRINPNSERATKLLELAQEEIAVPTAAISDFVLIRALDGVARITSPTVWMALQILMLVALLYLIYRLLFTVGPRRWGGVVGILLLTMLLSGVGMRSHYLQNNRDHGVYISSELGAIYQGADGRSPEVSEISAGVTVRVLDEVGEWYKVQLPDRDVGWVQKKKVSII